MTAIRPHTRADGILTRIDAELFTPAERAIGAAMQEVESAGASPALTDAVSLLSRARDRVADHVEGLASAQNSRISFSDGITAIGKGAKLYTQAEFDAAIMAALDRDRIESFMAFAKNLPDKGVSMVYGTNLQARAIMRALAKVGF